MRVVACLALTAALVIGLLSSPLVLWVGLTVASTCLGPFWRGVSPLRLVQQLGRNRDLGGVSSPGLTGWIGAGWLLLAAWLSLSGQRGGATALLLTLGYAALQLALTWRRPRLLALTDAVEACNRIIGSLAPFGRGPDGRFELRSPAGALARVAGGSRHEVALLPVSAALIATVAVGLVHTPAGTSTATGLAAWLLAITLVCRLTLAVGAHRAFLAQALLPVPAGWALAGAVHAANTPVGQDAVVLLAVALLTCTHVVALSAAHRMAVNRFDIRSARAVQFPFRVVVLISALVGAALLAR